MAKRARHRSKLAALRDELGHIQVQKLSKADLDDLVGRMWRGEVKGRDNTPRQGARDDVKHRKRL